MSRLKSRKCDLCDIDLDKNSIGLNRKLLNRESKNLYCISCMANYLDVTVEDLLNKIEEFKEQGCKFF